MPRACALRCRRRHGPPARSAFGNDSSASSVELIGPEPNNSTLGGEVGFRIAQRKAMVKRWLCSARRLSEALPWGGGAPPARAGVWIGRGARCRRFDLRRPGRRVDRRSARHRADHPRSWRGRAPDVPRGGTERGAGPGEGREAATAACHRWRAAPPASPLAAPAGLRIGAPTLRIASPFVLRGHVDAPGEMSAHSASGGQGADRVACAPTPPHPSRQSNDVVCLDLTGALARRENRCAQVPDTVRDAS